MSCRQVPQACTGPGRPAHCPGSSAAAAVPSGKKRGWGRLGRGWEGWGRGVGSEGRGRGWEGRGRGVGSEGWGRGWEGWGSRPCRQGRTITKARPPPPPRARAQASTPRACRVSRSHTPCPCYPPSHHLTLPTPSNYKSCQARLCQAPNHTRPAVPPPTIALALVPAPRRRTCTGCRAIGGTRRRPSLPPAPSATLRDDNRALLVSAVSPPRAPPCAGAPLPGRASHRAPARTTLQPLVTAHCHTGLGPWVGLGPCTTHACRVLTCVAAAVWAVRKGTAGRLTGSRRQCDS